MTVTVAFSVKKEQMGQFSHIHTSGIGIFFVHLHENVYLI